mmetsp:Transcript_23203/g.39790  ORF Transcript_23203/g.39790 Transcript_23203/m.39790 type:complete len:253 (+) Transcript_23203:2247-3005(+)
MRARVEPGIAAPHPVHPQRAVVQVHFEQRGDLKLAARRWLHFGGPLGCVPVEEVEPGDGIVRGRVFGLFDDLARDALVIEPHHAVAFGIGHVVAEDRAAVAVLIRVLQQFRQAVPEENVVTQHHGRGRTAEEVFGQQVGLRQPVGGGLCDVGERDAPLASVAQRPLELRLILRCGDHGDVAYARQHQHRDRVVDHRFVVDGQQLFGHAHGDRIEARAGAACEDDALAVGHVVLSRSLRISASPSRQSGRAMP